MTDKKDRKNHLITFRLSEEDLRTVKYMSDHMGVPVSGALLRAGRFLCNMSDVIPLREGTDEREKNRKTKTIHLRVTDADRDSLDAFGRKFGESTSQTFRRAIKEYDKYVRKDY